MRRALTNDVVKILCYVAGVLLLAAAISPMLYNGGKALFEVTHGKETNSFVKWLAEACGRSDFPRFFNRSVMLSALVLFFPLVRWLKIGRSQVRYRDTPWSFRLPESAIAANEGQPLQRDPKGWLHLTLGFVLALGGLALLAWWLLHAGAFVMENRAFSTKGVPNLFPPKPLHLGKVIPGALFSSLLVATLEEIVFRGVLLGIFLRAMKPWAAIASLSLLFAFLHFLDPKTLGAVPDPESAKAGFWLLGRIFAQYADPLPLLSSFCTLFVLGAVVAYARVRTAGLWMPIGLHAGWVFGVFVFKAITQPIPNLGGVSRFLIGTTLREGLLPLAIVAVTGVVIHFITRRHADRPGI
ncbi:CPBP family intramembrane metalloprotease [Luteolibacter ambystomatis]|uniref:CPBP family intramembrane metalloprotease n=1 Tax=Luteolibacter ambystomatis TaxID=2824561 RepID=A0A975G8I1_9BACT|nr:CPBP family intramembrane glutamic endopeptidase [Luteolibacter ambystomatis]QUE50721.1 CPBP family intramembrane metalloprotease [Luteolibacter ambystomatis]